jgi:hypothetical protein
MKTLLLSALLALGIVVPTIATASDGGGPCPCPLCPKR